MKRFFRDSWNVWREKVNAALGTVEQIDASEVLFDNDDTDLTANNVQTAIEEVNTKANTIALDVSQLSASKIGFVAGETGMTAENVQDAIEEINDKNFTVTELFKGDASAGGGVEVTVDDITVYDELMIYYNAGNVCSRLPVSLLKSMTTHILKIMFIDSNNVRVEASVTYVTDQKVVVAASQGSTLYLWGIKYKG